MPDRPPARIIPWLKAPTMGKVTRADGTHLGWLRGSERAILGTVQYASGRQVTLTVTYGDALDLRRGALVAICPVVPVEAS